MKEFRFGPADEDDPRVDGEDKPKVPGPDLRMRRNRFGPNAVDSIDPIPDDEGGSGEKK